MGVEQGEDIRDIGTPDYIGEYIGVGVGQGGRYTRHHRNSRLCW